MCPAYVRTPLVERQIADQARAHGLPEERVLEDVILERQAVKRLLEPSKRIHAELGIAGLKYAMDWNGYYGGNPRLPLLPLTGEQRGFVEAVLADLRS